MFQMRKIARASDTRGPSAAGYRAAVGESDTLAFRVWVEQEIAWAAAALGAIARQRELLQADPHGLDRFTVRMRLVKVTGAVAAWSNNLRAGFEKAGRADIAAQLAAEPPFAATDATTEDCDRLAGHVESRRGILRGFLAE